jgi:hypothetical protein
VAVPTFVAEGTNNTGTAGVIGGMPAGATTNDILVYHIESYGNEAEPTLTTGWTRVASTGVPLGSLDDPRITVWWAPYSAGIDRNVADTGDHTNVRILAYRGCDTTNPIDVALTGTNPSNVLSHTIAGPTTTVAECLVCLAVAIGDDSNTGVTSVANASLTSITSRDTYIAVASGNDGARFGYSGEKATAGATGSWTFSVATAERSAGIIYALKPPAGGGGGATHPGWRNSLGGGWF